MSSDYTEWMNRARAEDEADPLRDFRDEFYLPAGTIYLDGNSLGLLSKPAEAAVLQMLDDWKLLAIGAWTDADTPWFTFAERLSELLAPLVGAHQQEVIVTNSTSVNLHQILSTFYRPSGLRRQIVMDELAFPSDQYAVKSHLGRMGLDIDTNLRMVSAGPHSRLDLENLLESIDTTTALIILPSVVYTTGQLLNIARITEHAHRVGALTAFDCSHSVGVLPHRLHEWEVDFAFWCHYKYLNAGPGATGGLFVHEKHLPVVPGLAGWFSSSKQRQFDMSSDLQPAATASALQIGTPNLFSMAPLLGSLQILRTAGVHTIRDKSLRITRFLRELCAEKLSIYGAVDITPALDDERGGHITLEHPEAQRISIALRHACVIPDYRPPGMLRLCPAPLYVRYQDCVEAVSRLEEILASRRYSTISLTREAVT